MSKQVLIVEDDYMQREMLSRLLNRKLGMESYLASNGQEALTILAKNESRSIKIVIMDLAMPVMGGIEALPLIKQKYPNIAVIMLTGSKDIDDAVEAMKKGAIDFLTKPYEGERMLVTVKNALKITTLSKEVSRLTQQHSGAFKFSNLVGYDAGLKTLIEIGEKAASSDIPVLIRGETGVGKEVFSQAVHGESQRAGKAFIALNCGAIPSQLVESTLFGHEKGAFTGATEKTAGKFREADGGTIFLDEVGELPLDAQVKLLRVLQEGEVEPVGASKPVKIDVRVISATNRDLNAEVKAGNFREDLYFRLNVLEFELPPLRRRRSDVVPLAEHFIERFCVSEGRDPKFIGESARTYLTQHDWPGNVRQLENIIKRAIVLSSSESLEKNDFETVLGSSKQDSNMNQSEAGNESGIGASSGHATRHDTISLHTDKGDFKSIQNIEHEAMQMALKHFDGNTTQAAKALDIAKSTFYRKMNVAKTT
jgi:DNA-binding NtrC family response regulator